MADNTSLQELDRRGRCSAQITGPQDLLAFPLLQPARSRRLWPDILSYLGLPVTELDRSLTFDDSATMRRAAQQGLGVGLVSMLDAQEDIAAGSLVAPLGVEALSGMPEGSVPGFYLITTKSRLRAKHVAALHRWLLAQRW